MKEPSFEYKDEVLYHVRDGFGEVLSCLHDIVGTSEYSRLVDQFKIERIRDEEEQKLRDSNSEITEDALENMEEETPESIE